MSTVAIKNTMVMNNTEKKGNLVIIPKFPFFAPAKELHYIIF